MSSSHKRSTWVNLRISEKQRRRWKDAAGRLGISVSQYVRGAMEHHADDIPDGERRSLWLQVRVTGEQKKAWLAMAREKDMSLTQLISLAVASRQKQTREAEKIDAAFGRIADMIPSGNLLASADPVGFLDAVAAEMKDLRAENVKLKGTVSIKRDRVNDLEKALRDTLRQLERAINGNAMDGDWISAELHGRECLYSQA